MNYRDYITSSEWRDKHKGFLQKSGYRCAFSGLRIGKGKRYNCHHMHYENLGDEEYGRDIICLHPWFHRWVIHGILSGFKSTTKQKTYPNTPQQIAHAWCCLPGIGKMGLMGFILWLGITSALAPASPRRQVKPWGTSTQFVLKSAHKVSYKYNCQSPRSSHSSYQSKNVADDSKVGGPQSPNPPIRPFSAPFKTRNANGLH